MLLGILCPSAPNGELCSVFQRYADRVQQVHSGAIYQKAFVYTYESVRIKLFLHFTHGGTTGITICRSIYFYVISISFEMCDVRERESDGNAARTKCKGIDPCGYFVCSTE